jgi:O-antigen/teichoic acid export membrane protein
MIFLALEAEDILVVLYSDKWLPSVPYFQFLWLGFGLLLIVHQTNLSVLKALGKSDMVLYLEIIKKVLGISFILIATNIWGIMGIMYALTLNSIIEIFLNGYCVGRNIEYGIVKQLKDIIPTLSVSALAFCAVYIFKYIVLSDVYNIVVIVVCLICYLLLYLLLAKIFRLSSYYTYKNLIKEKLKTAKPKNE